MPDNINEHDESEYCDSVQGRDSIQGREFDHEGRIIDRREYNSQTQPDRRVSNQWILNSIKDQKKETEQFRESLNQQKEDIRLVNLKVDGVQGKVDGVQKSVNSMYGDLTDLASDIKKSIPDHAEHLLAHKQLLDDEKKRIERSDEAEKLKKEIRHKFIMAAVQGIGIAILSILFLGFQAQFSIWVNKSIDTPKATVEVKK